MAITSAVCNTFKAEIFKGGHNFNTAGQTPAGNAFKLSLYSSASANLDGTTLEYCLNHFLSILIFSRIYLV